MGIPLERLNEFFAATGGCVLTTPEQLEASYNANARLYRQMMMSRSRPGIVLAGEAAVAKIELCAYCAKERTGPGKCPECGARP